jgi:hypothetical protein
LRQCGGVAERVRDGRQGQLGMMVGAMGGNAA